jgi:uncharacterized protein YecT (DUF1311 family)
MKNALLLLLAVFSISTFQNLHAESPLEKEVDQISKAEVQKCKKLKSTLSKPEREAFELSQSAWEQFRDKEAQFQAALNASHGSNYQEIYLQVFKYLTKDRIAYLDGLLNPS